MLKSTRIVHTMAPFESISAKFALKRETCASKSSVSTGDKVRYKYFGARITSAYYPHLGGTMTKQTFYYRKNGRNSNFSADERTLQTNFANASRQGNIDVKNVSVIQSIRALYMANTTVKGVSPKNYTMRGWVIAVYYWYYTDGGTGTIDWTNPPA